MHVVPRSKRKFTLSDNVYLTCLLSFWTVDLILTKSNEEQSCSKQLLLSYFNKSTQNEDLQLSCLEILQSTDWWEKHLLPNYWLIKHDYHIISFVSITVLACSSSWKVLSTQFSKLHCQLTILADHHLRHVFCQIISYVNQIISIRSDRLLSVGKNQS